MKVLRKRVEPQRAISSTALLDPAHVKQWQYIQAYLKASDANAGLQSDIDEAMSVLPAELVIRAYSDLIRTTFTKKIVPALKQVIPSAENFVGILQNLSEGLFRYQACYARLKLKENGITGAFQALVRANIQGEIWRSSVHDLLSTVLAQHRDDELIQIHEKAIHIGLADIIEVEMKLVLSMDLRRQLHESFAGSWSESVVNELLDGLRKRPVDLFRALNMELLDREIDELLMEGLAGLRISELFDIIVDFPASQAALEDLKLCTKSAETRASLVEAFVEQCEARLLHPGANTPDIITIYISTIKVFLILDPPGVLLDRVARPIRKYLRERSDTIRCIIGSLLGEVDNDLAFELSEEQMPDEVEDEDDPLWLPDPIDAAPDYAKNRASDIIGSLISIYENKDVFARELQALLADRLLAITDYNVDQELHNLEMLKVRFGDGMLSVCDVMLKDMNDSRRIDTLVHTTTCHDKEVTTGTNVVHSTIISRLYWPNMKSTTFRPSEEGKVNPVETGFRLPGEFAKMLAEYSDEFARLKAQRNLVFQKDLGHIRVKLELEDRELDMLVTPVHAATIYLFNEVTAMPLSDVQKSLNLSELETRRNLSFWVRQGVLSAQDDTYTVAEVAAPVDCEVMQTIDEVIPDVVEEVDEMSTYWNFIVGMLTNVGALEPERIHSMLGMFAPSYDKSLDQLKALLQRRTREGAVEVKGGLYRLPAS